MELAVARKTATNSNRMHFEYLCRVCAVNTNKNSTEPECVYILKTPNLKDKLQKYLYLTVLDYDDFPKVLCKTCFRKVEATASLSRIAKQTQREFREFVQTMKVPVILPSSENNHPAGASPPEYIPLVSTDKKSNSQNIGSGSDSSPESSQTITAEPLPQLCHKDEVVVNVSINDPLTRETQHKMLSACQKQDRQKKSDDSPYAPPSIAQRTFTANPKSTESSGGDTRSTTALLISSNQTNNPSGVINFFHGRQAPQVTTYTSGGYMIGHLGETSKGITAAPNTLSNKNIHDNSSEINSLLHNKNSAIKGTPRNPTQTGQVSLLKVSQKPKPKLLAPKPLHTLTTNLVPVTEEETAEALPKKIIIASTKPKRDSGSDGNAQALIADTATGDPHAFPEDITLGRVIKDNDLLRLILKALKWPCNVNNVDSQINRLKSSKFTVIMSDPQLLQDTDLTQILGPYLRPAINAVKSMRQNQQKQQKQLANALAAVEQRQQQQNQNVLTSIPYKLPAETSVQLVPASPEAAEPDDVASTSAKCEQVSLLKTNRNKRSPEAILISDDDDDDKPKLKVPKTSSSSDGALMDRLLRQDGTITISRNVIDSINRTTHIGFDDDIAILVSDEHFPDSSTTKPVKLPINFLQFPPEPQITRPIIKRRKLNTMSTSVPLPTVLSEKAASTSATSTSTYVICPGKRTKAERMPTTNSVPLLDSRNTTTSLPPLQRKPSVALIADNLRKIAASQNRIPQLKQRPAVQATAQSVVRKVAGSKAALGQQLLEAIGLQKKVAELKNVTSKKIGSQSEPGQRLVDRFALRSALKRSLKQAQNQKQRVQEEPIIQDADSTTTKNTVKEVLVEAKLKNSAISSTSINSPLDLEDQIDKIELVVHGNKEKETTEKERERRGAGEIAKQTDTEQPTIEVKVEEAEIVPKIPRKRGRKRKEEKLAMEAEAKRLQVLEEANNSGGRLSRNTRRTAEATNEADNDNKRPVRASKTMSKYYKAPEKTSLRPASALRTTRNRH